MRRKSAVFIGVLLVAALILFSVVAFVPSTVIDRPPQIVLSYNGRQYYGAQGSYCWSALSQRRCGDYAFPANRTDLPAPAEITANSTVYFSVVGYFMPSSFSVSLFRQGSYSDLLHTLVINSVVLNFPAGTYFLIVAASWSGAVGDTSNAFKIVIV